MISFIVPAYNEAFEIPRTLGSIFAAARAVAIPFEVIVVDDDSNDRTAELAREAGARIVEGHWRQIAAVRNAGARAATGDLFIFVDADTQISESVLRATVSAIDQAAIGGGAWVTFAEPVNGFTKLAIHVFGVFYMRMMRWAAGCYVFATRAAFESVGGFDEHLYASEEISLSIALKRQGRFVIVREAVTTSARKLRMHSPLRMIPFGLKFLRQGPRMLRRREGLEWWYDGRREKKEE